MEREAPVYLREGRTLCGRIIFKDGARDVDRKLYEREESFRLAVTCEACYSRDRCFALQDSHARNGSLPKSLLVVVSPGATCPCIIYDV